jgi:hypothetical protein
LDGGPEPARGPLRRALLLACGWIAVGLALAGIPLPFLPTTPFLLLAAACFLRSSPRLHRKLLADPRFGPHLAQWQRDRSVPPGAKLRAFALVALTFGLSIALVDRLALRAALAAIGLALLGFLASLRTGSGGGARPGESGRPS